MRLARVATLLSILASGTLTASCVPVGPRDLRVQFIRAVPASALPTSEDGLREAFQKRGEQLVEIMLQGDKTWVDWVGRLEMNGYANVWKCGQRDWTLFSLGPYVGDIAVTDFDPNLPKLRNSRQADLIYRIYLPVRGEYHSEVDFNKRMPSYDLGRKPVDVCLELAGGNMAGMYARSNTIRIRSNLLTRLS